MKKLFFYIFVIVCVGYGSFLRFYELETGTFWIDEGYSALISLALLNTHFLPQLGDGTFAFGQYFFHIFQALSFHFLGFSDFSARLPSFVFGIFHIVIFYFFTQVLLKESKYKYIGIIFLLFLFLFSTWNIIWSREARFYEMLGVLYLLVIFLLYQYMNTKHYKYFLLFFIFLLIGIIFHQFFFAFLPIVFLIFAKDFFQKRERKMGVGVLIVLFGYIIWQIMIQKIILENTEISLFLTINSVQEYHFFTFFYYYIGVLYEQLGIIFGVYILGIGYFLFFKKWKEFLLFGGLFFTNIVVISLGYFAHSRYMFHLFSLVILGGGYFICTFLIFLFEKYKYRGKRIFIGVLLTITGMSIFFTYQMTFIPQRFYYIDATSPKPNFKNTYQYIEKNHPDKNIISGFPHMCYWYNRKNTQRCEFALRVNLIGNSIFDTRVLQKQTENYTHVKYIDNLFGLNLSNYLFVLDDLTLKNAINKELINEIKQKCYMFYRDIGNHESHNLIGIWKCQ